MSNFTYINLRMNLPVLSKSSTMTSKFISSEPKHNQISSEDDIQLRKKFAAYNELDMEREDHISKSEERYEIFKDILNNQSRDVVTPKYLLYALLGILPALASKWVYTLVPVHNAVLNPSYWYELPLQLIFGYLIVWTTYGIYVCSYFMNIRYIKKIRHGGIVWMVMIVKHKHFLALICV